VDIVHVPYKGGGAAMVDVIGNRVTVYYSALPSAAPQIRSGKLIPIAVTSDTRADIFPDIPTIAESGYPGFESVASYGFFAPAGTPKAIIDKLNKDINAVLLDPQLKEKLLAQGIEIEGSSPEALQAFVKGEVDKWARVIKTSNIKPE
jgi:tripartite-type tricarboxylate transporter receptor subunit TctC